MSLLRSGRGDAVLEIGVQVSGLGESATSALGIPGLNEALKIANELLKKVQASPHRFSPRLTT